ncbi:CaiB/BaiF CoA transferase family protein [Paracoccus aerodenitrificans]|uniref:CaiB/BaiF CoA transferase family protein n=1 Tax=Paracoccus aerodenitrificans TaxID=3017781 RepID=UPI0022F0CF84|nr:CaiB/BaiF CoA-transferase family protein [Paracoccus aerodenitrificans]WBU62743.1 CaiB/BaiF CoA-transferase family protein [Paracoccus aerodenitrificans]
MSRPPLSGIRIIELSGIGPGPFAAMMLADHGAEVIRVERIGSGKAGPEVPPDKDILLRSRKTIEMDLKKPASREIMLDLVKNADGLIEGFRPGVIERLGIGPEILLDKNPKLVIGRMTGWGQTGTMSEMAGHDLNYIAISGALHGVGRKGGKPVVPLNLFGDFGGGGMFMAFGMLAALHHAKATGQGQVIDVAMTDGSALLTAMIHCFRQVGIWQDERGVNLLDGGAHFYDTYETKDGKYISIGAIEPQFYARLLELLGLKEDPVYTRQMDAGNWDVMRQGLERIFLTRTRDEWDKIFIGSDACYAPVLSLEEAAQHPHNASRKTFQTIKSTLQPSPAPRYSVSPTVQPEMFNNVLDTDTLLASIGYSEDRIRALRRERVIS